MSVGVRGLDAAFIRYYIIQALQLYLRFEEPGLERKV